MKKRQSTRGLALCKPLNEIADWVVKALQTRGKDIHSESERHNPHRLTRPIKPPATPPREPPLEMYEEMEDELDAEEFDPENTDDNALWQGSDPDDFSDPPL